MSVIQTRREQYAIRVGMTAVRTKPFYMPSGFSLVHN